MSEYGVTEKGFVLKRMDTILEEIHTELTEGFGFDTRLQRSSFLDVLVTTFAGQIADLWETAQDSYYAKYPSTASGINLDNAVQYGGIRRAARRRTIYPLHCTGEDGAVVPEGALVAADTSPEVRLLAASEFQISRDSCNSAKITVAAMEKGEYSLFFGGKGYRFYNEDPAAGVVEILEGLQAAITDPEYEAEIVSSDTGKELFLRDTVKSRSNTLFLSDNLTTSEVTTIANFFTQNYGRISLSGGVVSKMVDNIAGFTAVENLLAPTYGREQETDVELRQSYIAKSAIRSTRMIDSVCAQLLNNVQGVESATGYENYTDFIDEDGRPPHSIEFIVDGGNEEEIAAAILDRRAAGIQTFGSIKVDVATEYGDSVPVCFNRPEYVLVWMKVILDADIRHLPTNYASLTVDAILESTAGLKAGDSLLTQTLNDGIYSMVGGLTYVSIQCAVAASGQEEEPEAEAYTYRNVPATSRQKIVAEANRIEVTYSGHA